MQIAFRFDMRAPSFGTDRTWLYHEMLEMVSWGDRCGFTHVRISEHHGVADGYLPAPLIGQHTREIVEDLLGYSHEELRAGFADGTFWPTRRARFRYMEEMLQ